MESSSMVSGNLFIGAQHPGIKEAPEDEKKPTNEELLNGMGIGLI